MYYANFMEIRILLEAIEKLPEEGKQELEHFIEILIHKYIPEYAKVVWPTDREDELTPEVQENYQLELDRRLERMEKDPHPGYTGKEVIKRLEERIGRKLQI